MRTRVLFFVFFILTGGSFAGLKAFFGYSTFYSPGSGPYAETHLYVLGQSVLFKKNSGSPGYEGTIKVAMLFKQNDTIKAFQKVRLHSQAPEDTVSTRDNFVDVERFALPCGDYDFEIEISDENSTVAPYHFGQKISVFYDTGKLAFSDIEFLESYAPTSEKTNLSKNGYELIPYVSDYYPENMHSLSFYTEVYNTRQTMGDTGKFVLFYSIRTEDNRLIANCSAFSRQMASEICVLLGTIDLSQVPSGNFKICIELRDRNNKLLLSSSKGFQRKNKVIPADVFSQGGVKPGSTFASRITDRDSLIGLIQSLWPISGKSDKAFIDDNAKGVSIDLLQQFFYNFWKNRNEQQPETEWNKYALEVRKVNKSFGAYSLKGYSTDRGRVYLQYGPPDNRVVGDNEVGVLPYEIWTYYKMNGQSNRHFIFYNPDYSSNNFILLHSDARGESQNENWEAVLNKRGLLSNDRSNDSRGSRTQNDFLDAK